VVVVNLNDNERITGGPDASSLIDSAELFVLSKTFVLVGIPLVQKLEKPFIPVMSIRVTTHT